MYIISSPGELLGGGGIIETWYVAPRTQGGGGGIIVCSNDDPRLTLMYFVARSKLVTGFSIGKSENSDFYKNYCSL